MVSTPDELRFDGGIVRDETGYTVPGGPVDEMAELFATIIASAEGLQPGPGPGPAGGPTPD